MNREEKNGEIAELTKAFSSAKVALCADYRGMTVAKVTTLRKKLQEKGARAKVVKNTLAKISLGKAHEGSDKAHLDKFLGTVVGTSMMIYSDSDPVAPAKVLMDFMKDAPTLQVKGGWFEGVFMDPKGVEELSKMPGREETLAKLLALINTPATQLLRLMNAPGQQTVQVLEGHRANLEKKGA